MVVTSLQLVNFYQLVQAAINIEKSEMKSQERKKEKRFSRRGSSSGKILRESQVDERKDLHAHIVIEIIMVCVDK